MDEMKKHVKDVMQCIFGFTTFKSPYQREGVLAVLQGVHDVFINLPPNGGKSLCYQLPAIISEKKSAIVFVRNNNVAQEHVKFFIGKEINVCHIDSSLQPNKKQERIKQLKFGNVIASLIYVPVSLCNKPWIKDLIATLGARNSISIFVLDDIIHLSHNSASFNKSSLDIVPLRNMFPNVPLVALTACASQQIKYDIFDIFSMKNPCEIISNNWILPNIYIQVKFKDIILNPYQDLIEVMNNFKDATQEKSCGIIFCRTKEESIIVAQELSRFHVPTVPYNASMSILDRKKNKSMWKVGKATMIAVTHDSAIGLDKPNVTCIIHWSLPPDISIYYKEIGKAGRNGIKALCCLYFTVDDWMYIRGLTMGMSSYTHDSSEKMIQFCLSEECRHTIYSKYFGTIAVECESSCDWCVEKDNAQRSLEAFNDFQTEHRLLSLKPQKNVANALNAGVYHAQNAGTIIKNIRPNLRFYWYKRLASALIKNYELAYCLNKKEVTMKNLCRLARNLEYLQLFAAHRRTTYIFTISSIVDAINKQTITKSLSPYILNYDGLVERTERNIHGETEDLLSI